MFPALFKYESKREIGWDNWLTTLLFTQMRSHVEKGDVLGWTLSYIKSSTWNHIFIILATILDRKRFCKNYVEAGEKCPKCPKLSSRAKKGRTWKTISTVTGLLTLIFGWQMSTGVISCPVKVFSRVLNFG